ncbi:hypothetical protein F5Y09DRAFT_328032 [Xylaria sp. FL1042]|nr:hypothetical protein F5Y09DRAFT_328032 [Xylaria sp. FL1042]
MRDRFAYARLYLEWMETNLEITPHIKDEARVELVLKMLMNPANNVPGDSAQKAKELLSKYEAENWGQDLVTDEDSAEGSNADALASAEPTVGIIRIPLANDPLFGTAGIMYGVMVVDTGGGRKNYRLRPDLPKIPHKVYGNNGINLGAWYPFQINALFWGAHGARMGGISGSSATGAWSIVVARTYEDLDADYGSTLYYSGSNSHTNKDPEKAPPASQGTKTLHASLKTQYPIRVLRSGGAYKERTNNSYLPSCGLRYDGLYRVTSFEQHRNRNGGLYDRFRLVRLPGQTPLRQLQRSSPTIAQVSARDRL